jgi:hypothetical protein
MPSDPKKRITARCSTTVQFESSAATLKENWKQTQYLINLTLTRRNNA